MLTNSSRLGLALRCGLCVLVAVLAFAGTAADAGDHLTVETVGGQRVTAEVDSRTDKDQLWLRFGNESITLLRGVAWGDIVAAQHDGDDVPLDKLYDLATALKSDASNPAARQHQIELNSPLFPDRQAADADADDLGPSHAERARAALGAARRITSIQIDAYVANWDSDVEADGLILHVLPLADHSKPTKASGTMTVELVTLQRRGFAEATRGRGSDASVIGRWSKRVWAEDIGRDGAAFRLPFQSVHPEFDTHVGPYGLVHVRFSAPGHGTFDSSIDAVRIRPFAPLRDELERAGRGRFLPTEATGRR